MGHTLISYSRHDADFATLLAKLLRERGVAVWLDQDDIPAGADWNRAIDAAIEDCSMILVILSPDAAESEEVIGEVLKVRDKKKFILPILHKPCKIPRTCSSTTTSTIEIASRATSGRSAG